jgi:hypothetical protein
MRFHTPEYVNKMRGIFDLAESTGELQVIDEDTMVMAHTGEVGLLQTLL